MNLIVFLPIPNCSLKQSFNEFMNKDLSHFSRRDLKKVLGVEHLNNGEFQLLSKRRLEKETMCWAVRHLSECYECSTLATPQLTEKEIKVALSGTKFDRPDLIEQTINYYFETLKGRDKNRL